jgi:hypothetical protein
MDVSVLKKLLEPYSGVDILFCAYDCGLGEDISREVESLSVVLSTDGEVLSLKLNLEFSE